MLQKLQQVAQEGAVKLAFAYVSHIKKEEDRKVLDHAEAYVWEDLAPEIQGVLERQLYQCIEGIVGEVNFPSFYTGEVLSVEKVASAEFDRTKNRPAVEVLEAIRDMTEFDEETLIELGNAISYKVLAASSVKNHLVALVRFQVVPQLGAQPVQFVFGTTVDLDDREESLFDELSGKFKTQVLNNVVKKGNITKGVLFPCLDDEGRESADLMVYAASGGAAWFKALEATLKLSPRREGQALVRMITAETADGEVPHDLFKQMGDALLDQAAEGMHAESMADSLESALGHGIDRGRFQAAWETTFGDLGYRPTYDSLFGGTSLEKPAKLKMKAGDSIQITLTPADLEHFRQITVNKQTFIAFAVPEQAKVVIGKDLDLKIRPVTMDELRRWIEGQE